MKKKKAKTGTGSWRDIQKNNRRAGRTKAAQQRKWNLLFRSGLAACLILSVCLGILGIIHVKNKSPLIEPSKHAMMTDTYSAQLIYQTDGVLPAKWYAQTFKDLLQGEARAIDLQTLKSKTEEIGQIKEANIRLDLPDRLIVELKEREPVVRVRIRDKEQKAKTLLIARDGHVYEGLNYPLETIRRIPGAKGLRLLKVEGKWAPVRGMDKVAVFIDQARLQVPSISQHWRIINLESLNPQQNSAQDLIEVSSGSRGAVVFSLENVERQLVRLAQIMNHTRRYQLGNPKKIDLSFSEEAVIQFN